MMPQISWKELERDPVVVLRDALTDLASAATVAFPADDVKLQRVLNAAWEALMQCALHKHEGALLPRALGDYKSTLMSRGTEYYEHRFYGGTNPWTGVSSRAASHDQWVEFIQWIKAWRDYLDTPPLRDGTDVTDGVTGPVTAAAKTPPAHRSTK